MVDFRFYTIVYIWAMVFESLNCIKDKELRG